MLCMCVYACMCVGGWVGGSMCVHMLCVWLVSVWEHVCEYTCCVCAVGRWMSGYMM